MALSDWLIIGAFTIFAKKEIEKEEEKREQVRWKYAQDNSDLFELKSNWSRLDVESARKEDVNEKRQATPCKFMDGITYEDFEKIAQKAGDCIKRIKKVSIHGAVIYCTVESQTGCILRAPAVADALTTGRGAVIERSAGGAGQDCL